MFDSYQAAIKSALTDGPVGVLVGGRISQKPTDSEAYPKIWITDRVDDWSEKTGDGIEVNLEVHIGSKHDGDRELNSITKAVHQSLHNAELELTGGAGFLLCQYTGSTRLYDPDGVTRHAVVKFNMLITQE